MAEEVRQAAGKGSNGAPKEKEAKKSSNRKVVRKGKDTKTFDSTKTDSGDENEENSDSSDDEEEVVWKSEGGDERAYVDLIPKESRFVFRVGKNSYSLNSDPESNLEKLSPFLDKSESVVQTVYVGELTRSIEEKKSRTFYFPATVPLQNKFFEAIENVIVNYVGTCVPDHSRRPDTLKKIRSFSYYMLMFKVFFVSFF